MRYLVLLPLLLIGCGAAPMAGPSPVAPPAGTMAAAFPAGLDPAYVRTIAFVDETGRPKRWEGGPFHHCFGEGVDVAAVERITARMTALSGIQRTESGPCNVEWVVESQGTDTAAIATLSGTATAIYHARIRFATDRASRLFSAAMHEGGHVIGLGHSSRMGDLMHPTRTGPEQDFTPDELSVLAWMYGR